MLKKALFILMLLSLLRSHIVAQSDSVKATTSSQKKVEEEPTPPELGNIFKPTIGLGVGMLSYYGDLYSKHAQAFTTSRIGYEIMLSQPLSKSFYLNFYGLFGKLGANEQLGIRNENFQSEIRMGGIHLMYDFSNFIPEHHKFRPWIATGIEGFEFLSKTDLRDKTGQKYHYWADGSIRNLAETDPAAATAINLVRDYTYETDIRELNADGFGKYPERSWAIPIGVGFMLDINERAKFKIGTTFHLSFTDYIDGVTNVSTGNRVGTKAKDNFIMTSFSLHYDLVIKSNTDTLPDGYFDGIDYLVLDDEDEDGDGVTDFKDDCHKTPKTAKVDKKGCPVDEDKDMIADYYDEELPTPESMIANGVGIGITDEMAQLWYDTYFDSTGIFAKIVDLDSASHKGVKAVDPTKLRKEYTVELAKFTGGVPSDIMAYLLSIGDVRSTHFGDTTVVYTAGSYEDIKLAIQRKDEFIQEGVKDAKVGYFRGGKYYSMDNSEPALKKETAVSDSVMAASGTNGIVKNSAFEKGIIYRVQLGAYKSPLSESLFKHVGKVIELKTDDGYYKYVTEAYPTLEKAMVAKAEITLEGYSDAFVSAYKDGKRISLKEAGATFENNADGANEVLDENKNKAGALDKTLVTFKIQLGSLKKANDATFEERIKDLKGVQKTSTTSGLVRYTTGEYHEYNAAVSGKAALAEKGFNDVFVIATFKGEIISIQEALEILGGSK
jgi:hypothetical protein